LKANPTVNTAGGTRTKDLAYVRVLRVGKAHRLYALICCSNVDGD